MSPIDRFLISNNWLMSWPHSAQRFLDREFSDHCPLLLSCLTQDWGPKPFRVLNCWLGDPRFKEVVEKTWKDTNIQAWGTYVIKEKLKVMRSKIRVWNKEIFGDPSKQKKTIVEEMALLDKRNEEVGLTEEECMRNKELLGELWKTSRINESIPCQKAHSKWLKEGDRNSKYFHSCINWWRRSNSLVGLHIDGRWEENLREIKKEVKTFFENRFREVEESCLNLDEVVFSTISSNDNSCLCARFDPSEVKEVV